MRQVISGRTFWIGLLAAGALLTAARSTSAQANEVTFTENVASILQQKCQVCHRAGQMAPMSLVTYEEVRPWARVIRNKVAKREMPPWHLDKTVGIQEFQNDISLSDDQIDTIVQWVDAGAPRGLPAAMPPPVEWPDGNVWSLAERYGRDPDLIVTSTPWTQSPDGQERWTTEFGQLAKVGSRPRRRSLECHGSDGVILLS